MFVGLAGLSLPGLAACGGTPPTGATFDRAASTSRHSVPGLDAQTKANDALRAALGEDYLVALNLASTVPDWLGNVGARPMVQGVRKVLDQRVGVGVAWVGFHHQGTVMPAC